MGVAVEAAALAAGALGWVAARVALGAGVDGRRRQGDVRDRRLRLNGTLPRRPQAYPGALVTQDVAVLWAVVAQTVLALPGRFLAANVADHGRDLLTAA